MSKVRRRRSGNRRDEADPRTGPPVLWYEHGESFEGNPDVEAWIASFPEGEREAIRGLLPRGKEDPLQNPPDRSPLAPVQGPPVPVRRVESNYRPKRTGAYGFTPGTLRTYFLLLAKSWDPETHERKQARRGHFVVEVPGGAWHLGPRRAVLLFALRGTDTLRSCAEIAKDVGRSPRWVQRVYGELRDMAINPPKIERERRREMFPSDPTLRPRGEDWEPGHVPGVWTRPANVPCPICRQPIRRGRRTCGKPRCRTALHRKEKARGRKKL